MHAAILTGVLELAKRLIPDKEKVKELEVEIGKAQNELDKLLITTTTTPKVDAFVKILYAIERFINSLWRPIGSAAMSAFGLYCHYKGIDIGEANHLLLDGAFPAWGVSRHVEKRDKTRKKQPPLPDIELM